MFFIVGAQRSGTTYLYNVLNEHPEIEMAIPLKPEPKFFIKDNEYKKGKEYYYNKYFNMKENKVFGEKSTSYFEYKKAAKRIKNTFPEAKILISLRNPVDRAISNYFFTKNNGLEFRSINEVFINEKEIPKKYVEKLNASVSPFDYIERSKYSKFLDIYYKIFDIFRIKILIMEKFLGNQEIISSIYRFLDVRDDFVPSCLNKRINYSKKENVDYEVYKKLCNLFYDDIILTEEKYNLNLRIWRDRIDKYMDEK